MLAAMTSFPRYAIYFAAGRGSDLDAFGASLLGYDAWSGADMPVPENMTRLFPDWRELTQDPRQYGFHATLKAPMSLADGKTEGELLAACAFFAEAPRPVPAITATVDSISGFIAVVPADPSVELDRLAADCVRAFDCFRAPLTPEDRARRRPEQLTPRQRDYLDRWGYPYVMEEFRFHMTLTGRLEAGRRTSILTALRERFSAAGLSRLEIDSIALFRQSEASARFRVIGDWPLRRRL